MLFSGRKDHRIGVGFIVKRLIAKLIMEFWPVSERVIMKKLERHLQLENNI